MENLLILIGSVIFLYVLFKFDDRHNLNAQEMLGKYTWHSSVPPLALFIVFIGMAIASEAIVLYLLSFAYFIWFLLQQYRSYKTKKNEN